MPQMEDWDEIENIILLGYLIDSYQQFLVSFGLDLDCFKFIERRIQQIFTIRIYNLSLDNLDGLVQKTVEGDDTVLSQLISYILTLIEMCINNDSLQSHKVVSFGCSFLIDKFCEKIGESEIEIHIIDNLSLIIAFTNAEKHISEVYEYIKQRYSKPIDHYKIIHDSLRKISEIYFELLERVFDDILINLFDQLNFQQLDINQLWTNCYIVTSDIIDKLDENVNNRFKKSINTKIIRFIFSKFGKSIIDYEDPENARKKLIEDCLIIDQLISKNNGFKEFNQIQYNLSVINRIYDCNINELYVESKNLRNISFFFENIDIYRLITSIRSEEYSKSISILGFKNRSNQNVFKNSTNCILFYLRIQKMIKIRNQKIENTLKKIRININSKDNQKFQEIPLLYLSMNKEKIEGSFISVHETMIMIKYPVDSTKIKLWKFEKNKCVDFKIKEQIVNFFYDKKQIIVCFATEEQAKIFIENVNRNEKINESTHFSFEYFKTQI